MNNTNNNEHNLWKKNHNKPKHIIEKYKVWHHNKYRKDNLDYCGTGTVIYVSNNNGIHTKLPHDISEEDIQKETEQLKFKMGKYLANNKKVKITPKIFFQRYWRRFLLILLAALVFNFGVQVFLSRADTIPSGITGIPTILQYVYPQLHQYFALLYLACNVPLFLIFWRKSKASFMWFTLLFMICQIFINFLFTNVEVIHDFIARKILLVPGNTYEIRNYLYPELEEGDLLSNSKYHINILNEWIKTIGHNEFQPILLDQQSPEVALQNYEEIRGALILSVHPDITSDFLNEMLPNYKLFNFLSNGEFQAYWYLKGITWPILLYGSLGAAFIGMGVALSWKAGGSTGGTDIVAYYFSTKSKKNVANMLSSIAIVTAIIFLLIYAFIKPNPNGEYFGMRELSTFAYILVSNVIVNIMYPKYKKMKLTIISAEPEKVLAYFNLIGYWHSYRLERFKSGYTGKYNYKIETVILLLESRNLINDLKLIDPNIWLSFTKVEKVVGKFNTQFVE
ncbi:YitT family protein [Mycoplasma hafezii]|uniref:YitT family protein n=1 Tax=Mycoplasma hafezii TaxID=525886 RepID=UPI003CFA8415